jgi:hypothetical protein
MNGVSRFVFLMISAAALQLTGFAEEVRDATTVLNQVAKNLGADNLKVLHVIDLEYGQKAGRRVGAAVASTILLGLIGLVALLSKKRTHFLTIGFKDDAGKDQVAVIELGKDTVRVTLPIVETRSGKKIEYQDEEARNSAK